ncbi:MAG: Mu transposase C-terminal domain-containing protein [Bryobacterales bacterium]|nr:Mu transposase C-terminal domain-containing protein [Bryobacterales bacterium]
MNSAAGGSFTARDLAKALQVTPRAVRLRAEGEGWEYIKESHRGGLRHRYLLKALPLDIAVKALRRRSAEAAGSGTEWKPVFNYDAEALWREFALSSSKHREEGEFRARLLREVEALMRSDGLPFTKAARRVAAERDISFCKIRRWHYGWKKGGRKRRGAKDFAPQDRAAALVPRHARAGRPRRRFPEEWRRLFESLWLHGRRPTVADSHRRVLKAAEAAGLDADAMPSLRTVQSWVKEKIPLDLRDYRREGPRAVVAKVPKLRIDRSGVRVGQAVSGDGLVLDRVRVEFEDGEVRSPVAWVFQDEKSRYVAAHEIGKTENRSLFRHAVQKLARKFLPDRMTLDNTMTAASKAMTAGAKGRKRFKDLPGDPDGLLKRLNIEVHWTNPDRRTINPGAKLCERAFGIGGLHDEVQQHPRIRDLGRTRDRPVPLAEFRAAFDEAVQDFNRRQGRRDPDSAGRSYEQAFREGLKDAANAVRKPNPHQLEMLQREAQRVRVGKDIREVRVRIAPGPRGVHRYTGRKLDPWLGREVVVLFNPDDLSEDAWVEDLEGRRICRAEHLPDAAYGSREAAAETMRRKNRALRHVRKAVKERNLMSGEEVASRFPAEAVDPPPQPAVLTADFDMPAKGTAADGGAPNSLPGRDFLDEEGVRQGLELFEKQRKGSRRKDGMSGGSSPLDQFLWSEELEEQGFELYEKQSNRKRRGGTG